MPNEPVYCYIAKVSCGCVIAAAWDDPEQPQETAKDIKDFIDSGYSVERIEGPVTLWGCIHKKPEPVSAEPARNQIG